VPPKNWIKIQKPRTITAGSSIICMKKNIGTIVVTLARGKVTIYAP